MLDDITRRYHARIKQINSILALLQEESTHAEEYRSLEGVEPEDVEELDSLIALLAQAYGVFTADKDIAIPDVLSLAGYNGVEVAG